MNRRAGWAVFVASCLAGFAGCGGAAGPGTKLGPLFEGEEATKARELAPDILAQAEEARSDAERAHARGDEGAAQDHTTRARLLLQAAHLEAERIEIEKKRLRAEAAVEESMTRALRDEQAQRQIDREVSRLLAARVAEEQAEKAFEHAAAYETRRHRARGAQAERAYREAGIFLLRRARLVLAAARAMGATEEALRDVQGATEDAAGETDATRRLALADQALSGALSALGEVRKAGGGPTSDMVLGLLSGARERGFEPTQLEEGLLVGPLGRLERGRAAQLVDLLAAFPHGPVLVVVSGTKRRAEAEGRRILRVLVKAGADEGRLKTEAREGALPAEGSLLFPAYALPAGTPPSEPQPAGEPR